MKWVVFNGYSSKYTFAADIQKCAESAGYAVPCEEDGTRHPGTDCNAKMRTIFKDPGMRKTFQVDDMAVIEVRADDTTFNRIWMEKMASRGVISDHLLRRGVVQLYSQGAVNALLSVMLKTHVTYEPDDTDEEWYGDAPIVRPHNLEKKRNKPKVSLFRR